MSVFLFDSSTTLVAVLIVEFVGEERTNRWHKFRCLFTTG